MSTQYQDVPSIEEKVGEPIFGKKKNQSGHFICVYFGLLVSVILLAVIFAFVEIGRGENATQFQSVMTSIGIPPYKYATKNVPPRTFQRDRGTCWAFAAVGVLEADYRANGIKKGFMKENEYVHFSEQAYGISMMQECHLSGKRGGFDCRELTDFVSENSTDGGEIGWLYFLPDMYNQVLPVSVCPYPHSSTGPDREAIEHSCPGMQDALKKNPIRFDITDMHTAYDIPSTKLLLHKMQRPLGWSSPTHFVPYYVGCSGGWETRPECSEGRRIECPPSAHIHDFWCAELDMPGYNMEGEFYKHDEILVEGGHAMLTVGYNDEFRTQGGVIGGFIIRNSWEDRVYNLSRGPRGSHSIAYWMQDHSDWDERMLCPNAANPRNWVSCIEMDSGPTGDMHVPRRLRRPHQLSERLRARAPAASNEEEIPLGMCLDDAWVLDAVNLSRAAMEFECVGERFGNKGHWCETRLRYFLDGRRDGPDGTVKMNFVSYDPATKTAARLNLPPMPADYIATIFQPIPAHARLLVNSDDHCGYYFFPYDVLSKSLASTPGAYYSTAFEINWDDQSYLAKKGSSSSSKLDYSLLEKSTKTQDQTAFPTPYPYGIGKDPRKN